MESNKDVFKKAFKNAFSKEALNADALKDASQLMGGLKEDEELEGGLADKKTLQDIAKKHDKKGYPQIDDMIDFVDEQLKDGIKVEMEHTKDKKKAKEIAMDHLWEDPNYYIKLKKIETKEATGSGSSGAYSAPLFSGEEPKDNKVETKEQKVVGKEIDPLKEQVEKVEATEATGTGSSGAYETPAMWAKSTKKKDWGPSRKTQYKGGTFVSVKKKCTKFPYCNQGDIKALNLYKNESVQEAIKNVSTKMNVSETTIKAILEYEIEKMSKRHK